MLLLMGGYYGSIPFLADFTFRDATYTLFAIEIIAIFLMALVCIHGREVFKSVGLSRGLARGWIYAFVSVLPMLLQSMTMGQLGHLDAKHSWVWLLNSTLIAGILEEFCFRGVMFGQLFRYACWGFVPAILCASVIFGALHLYQGDDMASALIAAGVTALGSVFFGWVYVESGYNLWTSIGLHSLMNFAWIAFPQAESNGATGGLIPNCFRVMTVLLAVGIIIWYKKKHHLPFVVNKQNLWINRGHTE